MSSLSPPGTSKIFNPTGRQHLTPTWTRPTSSSRHFPEQLSTELQLTDSPMTKPSFHHQLPPIPSFSDMSQSLANLLSAHPQLPLQGALGLSKTTQQLFHHYQMTQAPLVRTPSPKVEALLLQKVLNPTRENNPRVNPRAPTQIDPLIKLSMAEDLMTTLIQDPQDPHLPLSQN